MDLKFLNIPAQTKATTQNSPPKPSTPFEQKARETAENFEAVFLSQILKSMSVGLKTDGPFSGGHSEKIFREVMNEQVANQIARNGGIGLSDAVYREILKTQEFVKPEVDYPNAQ